MSEWANRSFFWANCAKNERFAQKTDELIPNPDQKLSETSFLIQTICIQTSFSRHNHYDHAKNRLFWYETVSYHHLVSLAGFLTLLYHYRKHLACWHLTFCLGFLFVHCTVHVQCIPVRLLWPVTGTDRKCGSKLEVISNRWLPLGQKIRL